MFGFKIVKTSVYEDLVSELSRAKALVIEHEAKEIDLRIALDFVKKELAEATTVAGDSEEVPSPKSEKKRVKSTGTAKKTTRRKVVKKVEE